MIPRFFFAERDLARLSNQIVRTLPQAGELENDQAGDHPFLIGQMGD